MREWRYYHLVPQEHFSSAAFPAADGVCHKWTPRNYQQTKVRLCAFQPLFRCLPPISECFGRLNQQHMTRVLIESRALTEFSCSLRNRPVSSPTFASFRSILCHRRHAQADVTKHRLVHYVHMHFHRVSHGIVVQRHYLVSWHNRFLSMPTLQFSPQNTSLCALPLRLDTKRWSKKLVQWYSPTGMAMLRSNCARAGNFLGEAALILWRCPCSVQYAK